MLIMAMPEDSAGEIIMTNSPTVEGAAAWERLLRDNYPTEVGNHFAEFRNLVNIVFPIGA